MIAISSLFFATYGIWTTLMGNFFGGYTASALRGFIVLLVLVPIAIMTHSLESFDWRQNRKRLGIMLFSSAFSWGPFYYAILHAGVGIAVAINYAFFVMSMFFFGWLFSGERFTKDKWLSCGLGLVGIGLVFAPSVGHLGWLALAAAAISGVSMSANTVMAKELSYNAMQSTIFLWITTCTASTSMIFIIHERLPAIGWHIQWFYIALFGLASIVASWLYISGLKIVEAGAAGILGLLEIVFSVLFGYLFFSQHIGFIALLGVAIIMSAALIPYVKDYNTKRGTITR
jgi:drug/metabolite transporter (DMT)-like permease